MERVKIKVKNSGKESISIKPLMIEFDNVSQEWFLQFLDENGSVNKLPMKDIVAWW